MRVQESKISGKVLTIMGKKKHKLRKQAKENGLCPSDSSDEGLSPGCCPHVTKAVNFNTLKKALKQLGYVGQCTTCYKDEPVQSRAIITDEPALCGATGGTDIIEDSSMFEDAEPTIWVCLQCGFQGCDRNSKEQHALKHFETPRSNSHSVVVNVNTWAIWCYSCDDEVNPETSRKLKECIEFVRKLSDTAVPTSASITVNRSGSLRSEDQSSQDTVSLDIKLETKPTKPKPIPLQAAASVTLSLPKVKGLSNLGNTCFFNAVMQNISQTYLLNTLISERGCKSMLLQLNGHKGEEEMWSDGDSSEEEEDRKHGDMPSLALSIGDPGTLTLSLLTFMKDMHNPSKLATICPNNLFGQVCKKAPRFKGFQQQDSHELLRHLLDGMKAEEIKRVQASILKQFHLSENTNPRKVDEETKLKVKEYGLQSKHTFIDEVFGGLFISTVQCEECHLPSQIYEPFLDISLPILEEKTVRPNSTWSWRKKEDIDEEGDKGPSKHQQKKTKRQAKKDAKRKPVDGTAALATADKDKTKLKPGKTSDSRSQSDGDISDADIEDNIESDVSRTKLLSTNCHTESSKPGSPEDGKVCVDEKPNVGSLCNPPVYVRVDRCDSAGRSEESTLTETSAGESRAGCSSCNSIASLSDSTCKASSGAESTTGLNQPTQTLDQVTEAMHDMDITEKNTHQCSREPSKQSKSDLGSSASVSLETEETTSASNGVRRNSSHRSHSSGYSSTATSSKSSNSRSRSQLKLEAKVKAMSTLAPRYQAVSQECSIRSCLNQFTAAELLTGSNKFGCESCTKRKYGNCREGKKEGQTVYSNASKQVLIFQPPAVLTIHLKRFQQVGFSLRKVNRHVEFPMMLDLAPYCSSLCKGVRSGQTQVLYGLYGVVEHSGRLTGGHYTAYVKVRPHANGLQDFLHRHDFAKVRLEKLLEVIHQGHESESPAAEGTQTQPPGGKWYYISDSHVSESTEAAVLRCQAYLLFYERLL